MVIIFVVVMIFHIKKSHLKVSEKHILNETMVPMLFVQKGDNYNSFTTDIKNDNNITASITLNSNHLTRITTENYVNVFITNKEKMSSEEIIAYLEKHE